MAVNTEALDDGKFVTGSSFSVVASRATVKGQDVVATSVLSTGGTLTAKGATDLATLTASTATVSKLANTGPFVSSATTNQSAATAKLLDGQFIFSIRSLTSNGALFVVRSGNSAWGFVSSEIG